jgi:aminoglycoside/choline kinase family phosphotransferase
MLNHYDQHLADSENNVLPLPQWLDTALANVPFETPVFARLRQLITDASRAGHALPVEQLLHQNGTETGTMVAELLTRTHQLSPNWQVKTDMPVPQEDENLTRSIESVVLHLEMLSYDRLERENRENLRQIEEQLFSNTQEEPEANLLRDWTDTLELYKFLRETSAETHTRLGIVAKKMRGD